MNVAYLLEYDCTPRQREIIKAVVDQGSNRKAAKELGISRQTVDAAVQAMKAKAAKQGYSPDHDMTHAVPDGFSCKGVSTLYGEDGSIKGQWVKSALNQEQVEQSIDDLIEALNIPKFKPVKTPRQLDQDMMNVYVFGDPHIDMLSYINETGHNWDLDIAIDHHISAMTDMVRRSPKADTGILATMGDLWHRDSLKAITPGSGNVVDVDGRLGRSYDRGVEMIRAMIDKMLKKYQKVKYVCVRGNHSETLELLLAKTIRIAYENEPRVEVLDNTPKHIPHQFGKNFLLFTHGDKLNDQKKADIVVASYRDKHGAAKFSHVLSGHHHHAYSKDMSGVLVEIFPVLPSPDAWHCESGFMSADKAASVLTYHVAGGIIGRTITNPRIFLEEKQ